MMAGTSVHQRRLAAIGNYQLSSIVLGKGSFSRVEMANHVILNRKVALKVMTLSKINDPYVRKNLQREASIMSRLSHPRIVALFEVCSSTEFFCLALDYFPGGTLCDLLQGHPQGKLEEDQTRIYFMQLVEGVSYIHSKGIIHRDIKLENIFLNKEKTEVVIGDFGLSNFWQPGAMMKTRCGSAEYAAPEIFDESKSYDQAVDIWSLGVVLYAMLCGHLPFEVDESEIHLKELIKIINTGLTKRSMSNLGQISYECKDLLSRILSVDQNSRIKLYNVAKHCWFSKFGCELIIDINPYNMSLGMQIYVAKMVQTKLKLCHLTPYQILSYVMSAKGRYGKTAGCFNLLARDFLSSTTKGTSEGSIKNSNQSILKESSKVSAASSSARKCEHAHAYSVNNAQPMSANQTYQNVPLSAALTNLDRLLQQKPVSSTPRRRAAFSTHPRKQDKENELVDLSEDKRARRESVKELDNNNQRINVDNMSGQRRVGRLKRVDFAVEQLYTIKEEVVRTPLADNTNHHKKAK